MSKYTTEVRYICETYADLDESGDYTDIDDIISEARGQIFGQYPIFDETYRPVLESKILRHYYTREICAESVGLWKLWLNNKMNEIMPYYNKLYQSELLQFNPFYDIDLSTSHARNENGERKNEEERTDISNNRKQLDGSENSKITGEGMNIGTNKSTKEVEANKSGISNTDIENSKNNTLNAESTSMKTGSSNLESESAKNNTQNTETQGSTDKNHKDKYSDTPQGSIQNLENDTYLTNARIIKDSDIAQGKEQITGNENLNGKEKRNDTSIEDNKDNRTDITSESGKNRTTELTSDNAKEETTDNQNTVSSKTEEFEKTNGISEIGNATNLGSNKGKEDFRTTEDYLENVQGKRGLTSYSELLLQYRKTFINIDMEIIDKLSPLFFNLW